AIGAPSLRRRLRWPTPRSAARARAAPDRARRWTGRRSAPSHRALRRRRWARSRPPRPGPRRANWFGPRSPDRLSNHLAEHVLDAVEQVALVLRLVAGARPRLELLLRQHPPQLFDQLALLARELLRRLHLHGGEQIAAAAAVDVGHALVAQAQRRAGLRPLRHLHRLAAVERRYLNLAAQRDGGEVHRDLAEQVVAVAAEELVLLDVDDDVEVAGGTAGRTGFAFAVQPQLLAGGDAGGNLDGDLAIARHPSGAVATLARLGDDLAGATALRAGARDGEEALLIANLALALALRAGGGVRPGRRSSAVTLLAALLPRNLHARFGAAGRFLEADLEVVAQIGAALRPAAAASAAEEVAEAEHVAEDVGEVAEFGEDRRVEAAAGRLADAGVPEAIVEAALLRVGEDGVRLGRFLELLLGDLVPRVAIGVELHRQLPVRALDFRFGRGPGNGEDLVVVALAHAFATFTIAGRSRRSLSMYPLRSSPITSPSRCSGLSSCITAWCRFGSKSAPRASIAFTPCLRSRSWSLACINSTPLRYPPA